MHCIYTIIFTEFYLEHYLQSTEILPLHTLRSIYISRYTAPKYACKYKHCIFARQNKALKYFKYIHNIVFMQVHKLHSSYTFTYTAMSVHLCIHCTVVT